jgi:hypothetical protein
VARSAKVNASSQWKLARIVCLSAAGLWADSNKTWRRSIEDSKRSLEDRMTEIEQEHAQLIDLNLERLNRLEKELEDTKETLLAMMNMMTAYFESQKIEFEELNDD